MRKKTQCIFAFLLLVLVTCIILLPYLRVEILTALHKQEFEMEYMQTNMVDGIEYLKVMDYSEQLSNIYYVIENHSGGVFVSFEHKNSNWVMKNRKTVWSKSGSASDFMWPYYR